MSNLNKAFQILQVGLELILQSVGCDHQHQVLDPRPS